MITAWKHDEFMRRYGGNAKSMRNQTVGYLFDHLGEECFFAEIARHIKTPSTLGPGRGEPCTEENVKRAIRHVKWRVEKKQRLLFRITVGVTSVKMEQG